MLDYPCPECTTSVITALSMFKKHFPDYRVLDIEYVVMLLVFFSSITNLIAFLVARSKVLLSSSTRLKDLMEAGLGRGAFASPTLCISRLKVFRSSVRLMRTVHMRARLVSTSWANRGRMVAGEKASR